MANTKKTYTFTMTSHDAKRIERRHKDRTTLRWIGAALFEKEQLIMVDGHPEIVLEIAANLEIENVKHINTDDYITPED